MSNCSMISGIKNLRRKSGWMMNDASLIEQQIKDNIAAMINMGKLSEAKALLNEYAKIAIDDAAIISMKGIIAVQEGRLADAKKLFQDGLLLAVGDFDLQYNLAYVYELENNYAQAANLYLQLSAAKYEKDKRNLAVEAAKRLQEYYTPLPPQKQKIVFLVKQGLDSFLTDIIAALSDNYETVKVVISDLQQIAVAMEEADICWFEWCDELIIYASKLELAKQKRIICRLHSYEAFTDYPSNVNWDNVDQLVFVAEHIRNFVIDNVPQLDRAKTVVIPNGIDVSQYTYKTRKHGFNIAYVGYINYKKGPMLLLHAFKAICDYDKRYKLYIAGAFQDPRYVLYFQQMVQEMNLEKNVFYQGWQNNLDQWLEGKHYILCTSVLESQNMSVMQAMAKGIRPLIHNFVGCKTIYPEKYVWNTCNDIVRMLENKDYNSLEYRSFIAEKYSLEKEINTINKYISKGNPNDNRMDLQSQPLVSVCITNYNYAKYLEQAILSVVKQSYQNVELIIIDDCSEDESVALIQKYAAQYAHIKPIYNESNKGYRYGISRFISEWCTGKYFIILSADDMLATDATIETFVQAHENAAGHADFIYGDQIVIDKDSNFIEKVQFQHFEPGTAVTEIFNRLGSGVLPILFAMHRTDFYRKNQYTWEEINGVANDTLNSLIAIKRGARYLKLDYPIFQYRQHSENTTFNLKVRLKDIYGVIDYIIQNFDMKYYVDAKMLSGSRKKQEVIKLVHLVQYYYSFISYYYRDYKIYGMWELQIPDSEKLLHLQDFKERCFSYIETYLQQKDITYRDFVLKVKQELITLYGE